MKQLPAQHSPCAVRLQASRGEEMHLQLWTLSGCDGEMQQHGDLYQMVPSERYIL
jgi:hypothetical protein